MSKNEAGERVCGALITLCEMREGERGVLCPMSPQHALYGRLRNLGWRAGVVVVCVRRGPRGTPIAYRACGVTVALRATDASTIFVQKEEKLD